MGVVENFRMAFAPLMFRLSNGGPRCTDTMVACPNCYAPAFIRRSERLTETVKHMQCHCTNTACGLTFEAEIIVTRIFSPGGCLRDDIGLPIVPRNDLVHIYPPSGKPDTEQISMFEADTT